TMEPNRGEVAELLRRWSEGDGEALDSLMPLVYEDLRRLAGYHLRRESSAQTLQSTALVHEGYMRMGRQPDPQWNGRAHFFAVAAKMIRRILVDHARRKSSTKRGGRTQIEPLDTALTIPVQANLDIVALDDALRELAAFDERKAQVVEMRFFVGLSAGDIASG